ncbi:MAG: multiheme c-type cytochrome [Planctomycetota bacterium]
MRIWISLVVLSLFAAAEWKDGARWGCGRFRPQATNHAFATADGCALCHSTHWRATANLSATGEDISPYGLWQGTMMANSFRDPYWRAQVAREIAVDPENAAETQALCLRCHGPMASHTARLKGEKSPPVGTAAFDPLARDGVSCTVCHQAHPANLGEPGSFNGRLDIRLDRKVYGPYEDPVARPMLMHSDYEASYGAHMRKSDLCGSCHTLVTGHFPEQTPYLEWLNSDHKETTCQECHMAEVGPTRIARSPGGFDFLIEPRKEVRAHAFVGGNAFMLRMLRENSEDLGVTAPDEALQRMEKATRQFLSNRTARLTIGEIERTGDRVAFDVKVENLTGHKLPTAYPSRRVWLRVQVRQGRRLLFDSGRFDEDGRLVGKKPGHHTRITDPDQVQVYSLVAADKDGRPTTSLLKMSKRLVDNRILPRGWKPDGPHADKTSPQGTGEDGDFVAGSDTVRFEVAAGEGRVRVLAWLHYQSIPPSWVDPLRKVDAPEAKLFTGMYDEADKTPEDLAVVSRFSAQ